MKKVTIAMLEKEMMEEDRLDLIKMIETIENPKAVQRLRTMIKSYLEILEEKNTATTDQSKSCI